jgi:hypothetical protein
VCFGEDGGGVVGPSEGLTAVLSLLMKRRMVSMRSWTLFGIATLEDVDGRVEVVDVMCRAYVDGIKVTPWSARVA